MAKTKRKADDVKPKKKARAVEVEEDDEYDDDRGGDDVLPRPPSRNDAYTGMLLISLVCLVAATVLLLLDSGDMTASPLANPTVTVPALVTPTAAAAPAAAPGL